MIVNSSAPTRIDLAGGTTDIWPLYLFHPGARTVNVAINLRAKAKVEQMGGNAIEIHSEDQDSSHRLPSIDYVDEIESGHPLELILRLLAFFRPNGGLNCALRSAELRDRRPVFAGRVDHDRQKRGNAGAADSGGRAGLLSRHVRRP
jgi:D-glycero-alpha-D-manno-heptose-7-phosphate kinase